MKNIQDELLKDELRKYLEQKFVNDLNEMGVETGMDSKELPEFSKCKKKL